MGAIKRDMEARRYELVTLAAAQCFFSKTLDALGAEPDEAFMALDKNLRQSLTVGRPISEQSREG